MINILVSCATRGLFNTRPRLSMHNWVHGRGLHSSIKRCASVEEFGVAEFEERVAARPSASVSVTQRNGGAGRGREPHRETPGVNKRPRRSSGDPLEPLEGQDLIDAALCANIGIANDRASSSVIGPDTEGIPVSGSAVMLAKMSEVSTGDIVAIGRVGVQWTTARERRESAGSGELDTIGEINARAGADTIGSGGSADLGVEADSSVMGGVRPADPLRTRLPNAPWSPTAR